MRLTSLLGRSTEGQIENLNIQDRRITNPPRRNGMRYINLAALIMYGRDSLFFSTANRETIRTVGSSINKSTIIYAYLSTIQTTRTTW